MNMDNSYFPLSGGEQVLGRFILRPVNALGELWFPLPCDLFQNGRVWGLDWGLAVSHTEQRSRGRVLWSNAPWRWWHTHQLRNIICHKWGGGGVPQPNSWLKALLVMPIKAALTRRIRPTCQIARLIHTDRILQYYCTFWLEACCFQSG